MTSSPSERASKDPIKIWRSSIQTNPQAWTPFHYHIGDDAHKRFTRGRDLYEPISEEDAPEYLHLEYYDWPAKKKNNLKDIFTISGVVLVVTEKFKNVLDDFDLGQTQLIPVPVLDFDQKTQLNHKLYILHIAEKKKCFIPELSDGVVSHAGGAVWTTRDDVLAVDAASAEGLDLWVDPLINKRIFMTDRLAMALKKAKLKMPNIGLARCKVIDKNVQEVRGEASGQGS